MFILRNILSPLQQEFKHRCKGDEHNGVRSNIRNGVRSNIQTQPRLLSAIPFKFSHGSTDSHVVYAKIFSDSAIE